MLAKIRDDTWNVCNMQQITPNLKRWDYSEISSGGHENIKGPAYLAEVGHHLWKACNPHPQPYHVWFGLNKFEYFYKWVQNTNMTQLAYQNVSSSMTDTTQRVTLDRQMLKR